MSQKGKYNWDRVSVYSICTPGGRAERRARRRLRADPGVPGAAVPAAGRLRRQGVRHALPAPRGPLPPPRRLRQRRRGPRRDLRAPHGAPGQRDLPPWRLRRRRRERRGWGRRREVNIKSLGLSPRIPSLVVQCDDECGRIIQIQPVHHRLWRCAGGSRWQWRWRFAGAPQVGIPASGVLRYLETCLSSRDQESERGDRLERLATGSRKGTDRAAEQGYHNKVMSS